MDERLWAGAEFKCENAFFHLEQMGRLLDSPRPTGAFAAMGASGTIIGNRWQLPFYAHLDAFLAATRSVPEIIRCCFGVDHNKNVEGWFKGLEEEEKGRRRRFNSHFAVHVNEFQKLPLSKARDISLHRTGYPPATIEVSSMFGVVHLGTPIEHAPEFESQAFRGLPFQSNSYATRPNWSGFKIVGGPLFETCQDHLAKTQALIAESRRVANLVHGTCVVSLPPHSG